MLLLIGSCRRPAILPLRYPFSPWDDASNDQHSANSSLQTWIIVRTCTVHTCIQRQWFFFFFFFFFSFQVDKADIRVPNEFIFLAEFNKAKHRTIILIDQRLEEPTFSLRANRNYYAYVSHSHFCAYNGSVLFFSFTCSGHTSHSCHKSIHARRGRDLPWDSYNIRLMLLTICTAGKHHTTFRRT